MSFLGDFSLDVVTGLVAGYAGSAITVGRLRAQERSRACRMWRLEDPSHLAIIVSTSEVPRQVSGTTRLGTGVGQLRAVSLLTPSLMRGYRSALRPDMVMLSANARPEDEQGDLVLLGGPRTNSVAAKLCAVPGLPVYMCDAPRADGSGPVDSRIHWAPPGRQPEVLDTADEGEWAYGMVLRHRNLLVDEQPGRLWMIAGTSTYGTQAAAEWVAANQKLLAKAPKDRPAAYVIKARLMGSPAYGIRTPVVHRSLDHAQG
ncbi:hypothetical protein ACI78V_02575 [Geodermatophilus sp. SYSU D00742]